MSRLGLIAGAGKLPVEFMRAAKALGHEVVVISVIDGTDSALKAEADAHYDIHVAKINKIFKTLHKEGIKELTMLGKVTKELVFKGLIIPDMRAIKLMNRLRNHKDDTIMLALVDELASEGISVIDQTQFLKDFMPAVGTLTSKEPTEQQREDMTFGFKLAKAIGGLDVGQTVVVKKKAAMALEAIEGTDACIRRGGSLANGDAVVVKTAKPNQDPRFDVPAVGMTTLQSMIDSGCKALAIEAKRTLVVDRETLVEAADKAGIVICAIDGEEA